MTRSSMAKCSTAQARRIIEAWQIEYNTKRTHSSLGNIPPLRQSTQQDC